MPVAVMKRSEAEASAATAVAVAALPPATSPEQTVPATPKPNGHALKKETRLVAPMPGLVVLFEKAEGDEVAEGDVVLILEAMKMENLITAPVAGKVIALHCKENDKVAKGAVLAVIG